MDLPNDISEEEKKLYRELGLTRFDLRDALERFLSRYFVSIGRPFVKEVIELELSTEKRKVIEGTKSRIYKVGAEYLQEGESIATTGNFFIKQYLDEPKDIKEDSEGKGFVAGVKKTAKRLWHRLPKEQPENQYETGKALKNATTRYLPPKSYPNKFNPGRKVQVFPTLLSIGNETPDERKKQEEDELKKSLMDFDQKRLLLLEIIKGESLDEKLLRRDTIDWRDVEPCLDPVLRLHVELPRYRDKIRRELNGRDLSQFAPYTYVEHFLRYVHLIAEEARKKIPPDERKAIRDSFVSIAKGLMNPPDGMETIVQRDGYPSHNMTDSLVDAGGVVIGHRALQLGCLFGHPRVYMKFPDGPEALEQLSRSYVYDWLIHANNPQPVQGLSYNGLSELLTLDTHAAAIFGNVRFATAQLYHYNNHWIYSYFQAIEKLTEYFGKEGKFLREYLGNLFVHYKGGSRDGQIDQYGKKDSKEVRELNGKQEKDRTGIQSAPIPST